MYICNRKLDNAREVNEIDQHEAPCKKLRLWLPNIKRHLIYRTGRNVTPADISILYWGTQRGNGRDSEQSSYAARDREIFPASA